MLKILHLITSLEVGGAEAMLAKLAKGMDQTQFRNVVVSMTTLGPIGAELRAAGVTVLPLNMTRGRPSPRGLFRLVRILREYRPDLIQTWLYHADLFGLMGSWIACRRPIVWNVRCSDMDLGHYPILTRMVLRGLVLASSRPRAIVTNSNTAMREHIRLGYRAKHWEFIPNGFDLEQFCPEPAARDWLRRELGVASDTILIGLPARFDPMKDHVTFLAAAALLMARHEKVRFVAFGDKVDQQNTWLVEALARQGLTDRVFLLGRRRDVSRIFSGLDIVTLASAFGEGFPNVLGEAMATGLPCVSTDVGDAAEIVGDTGRIVPPRRPTLLAAAWEELLILMPCERARLGAAARRRVQTKFRLSDIIERYQTLYSTLVQVDTT